MKLSLLVPTWRRHRDLSRLLDGLKCQIRAFDEIIIIIGPEDPESWGIVELRRSALPNLQVYGSAKASVVHSLNMGLSKVTGDIVCLTDDDAVPFADWALNIEQCYLADTALGALGGQDWIQLPDEPELSTPTPAHLVGRYLFCRYLIGNHHRGSIEPVVEVDVLKGVNLSFRRSAMPWLTIDDALESTGAEVGWEIDLCGQIKQQGHRIVYRNDIKVKHFIGHREPADDRVDVYSPGFKSRIENNAYLAAKYRGRIECVILLFRSFFLGGRRQPGVIASIVFVRKLGFKVMLVPYWILLHTLRGYWRSFQKVHSSILP